MKPITRKDFLSYYKNIFRKIDQFKKDWQGRCARDIITEFDWLESEINQEYEFIEYLHDHPLTEIQEFDWILFQHFDDMIQAELEAIRPRIEYVKQLYYRNEAGRDEALFFTSL